MAITWDDNLNNNSNYSESSLDHTKEDHEHLSYDYDQQIVDSHISDSASPDMYQAPDHSEPQMQHLFFGSSIPESPLLVHPVQYVITI